VRPLLEWGAREKGGKILLIAARNLRIASYSQVLQQKPGEFFRLFSRAFIRAKVSLNNDI
jgi:hypothetical protein